MRQHCARILVALALACICFSHAYAQSARVVAQKAFPSTVLLVMEDSNGQPVSFGSGFVVREGVVATNLHVVEGAASGYAKLIGKKTRFEISGLVGIDRTRDLALLAVPEVKAASLPLADTSEVAVGDEVYAVGNPQGLEGTFSQGIISAIRRIGSDILLQITAPISPGSSGGPVLSAEGKVIGVAVATFKGGQNLNFAVPASYLVSLMSELKPLTTLSAQGPSDRQESIFHDLGGGGRDSLVGHSIDWGLCANCGNYTFSMRNQLRHTVTDVYCLVVFYDRSGVPLDFDIVQDSGPIPAGLAKRMKGHVDGSVQALQKKVEFRVLDFRMAE